MNTTTVTPEERLQNALDFIEHQHGHKDGDVYADLASLRSVLEENAIMLDNLQRIFALLAGWQSGGRAAAALERASEALDKVQQLRDAERARQEGL